MTDMIQAKFAQLILLVALVLGVSPVIAFAGDAVIQVKSVVEVEGGKPEITLGDLIVARGVSEKALAIIQPVRLADIPGGGETRSFTALGLEQVFRTQLRKIEEQTGEVIGIRIPTRVTVVRKSLQLNPPQIETELKKQFKTLCEDCEFEISNLNLPVLPPTLTDGSEWKLKVRPEMPKGSFSIPLEINDLDGARRSYWISGTVVVRRLVPVTSRAIAVGESVRSEDFNMQLKDVTFATDVPVSVGELTDSVASRSLAAGQILWRNMLRRELAVKSGEAIKVMAGNEEWQISLDGVAQNSGYIGDLVRVKIPRTQKLISGRLKEKGLVEVQ